MEYTAVRNDWDHIDAEYFGLEYGLTLVKQRIALAALADHFGWNITYWFDRTEPPMWWDEAKRGKYQPSFSTCVNAVQKVGGPHGPAFSCTSATEPTLDNINHCIDWILHCEGIHLMEIAECEEDY